MNIEQLLSLILKAGIYPALMVYIIVKGTKVMEKMADSLNVINRELGEIKEILRKKNG
jgi:hypothetical protein